MRHSITKSEDRQHSETLSISGCNFLNFLKNHLAHNENTNYHQNTLSDSDWQEIIQACKLMEQTHKGQKRKDKSPYHNHIYRSVQILCENTGHTGLTPQRIICCLLHDCIEDSKIPNRTRRKIKNLFGEKASHICDLLSKDKAITTFMKVPRNQEYFSRFESLKTLAEKIEELYPEKFPVQERQELAEDIAVIKIADRIDNLQTMKEMEADKIFKKIEETGKYLLPIAQELGKKYPDLLQSLQKAILDAAILAVRKKQEETLATI